MRFILFLISIPIIIGLLAGVGAVADGQVQVPARAGSTLLWVVGGMAGGFIILSLIGSAASSASSFLDQVMDIGDTQREVDRRQRSMHGAEPVEMNRDGSIIAYRVFEMVDGVPWSVGNGIVGDNPITGRERGSYLGGWNISDRVPTLNNTSGIYAAKRPESAILDVYRDPGTVLAKVELSGRVVEGERGYRAQYCRILNVIKEY